MMFYNELKRRFTILAREQGLLNCLVSVNARILKNEEAIGNPSRQDYPLLKGKEFLMEASFNSHRGQAYTDAPCETMTTLAGILDRPLDSTQDRALFVATLNAVMRYLKPSLATIHCHDDEPEECAREITRKLDALNATRVSLVGLQPAMLEALSRHFGSENTSCLDRDENQRGATKFGVPIQWGNQTETTSAFLNSDVVLATGSTIVNGSLPGLLELSEKTGTRLIFYGTSVAGTAELMSLERFCFKAI